MQALFLRSHPPNPGSLQEGPQRYWVPLELDVVDLAKPSYAKLWNQICSVSFPSSTPSSCLLAIFICIDARLDPPFQLMASLSVMLTSSAMRLEVVEKVYRP
jgi:hypothetical protein